jgi:hypothetical protein
VQLLIARGGLVRLAIILLGRRDRVTTAEPAVQIDIGAAPRAEWAKLLDVRLAADRARLRGLGGRAQRVGSPAAVGNLDAVFCQMASMGRDGIYGVFTGDAISRRHGIYGEKWHLRRLHRQCHLAPDGIYGRTWHLRRFTVSASLRRDGIYGGTWHLRRLHRRCRLAPGWHLWTKMASMAFAPPVPTRAGMASTAKNGIYGVCTVNAVSRRDGIYGQKWHLWRCITLPPPCAMASTARHGIYVRTWHLWRNTASMGPRHLQNAPAQAAALTQPKWIG